MQYSTRTLFGFVAMAALLVGFVALPFDFQGFLVEAAVLFAGVAVCFYMALATDSRRRGVAMIVAWLLGFVAMAVFVIWRVAW